MIKFPSLAEALVRCGYEKDNVWCEMLATVEPEIDANRHAVSMGAALMGWKRRLLIRFKLRNKLQRLKNFQLTAGSPEK